ncbi:MAG: DUF2600 family protein, partial [Solirubrobacteraceae bacterium]
DAGELSWRECAASAACSVLAIHALVALSASATADAALAERVAAAYAPACALMTLLDGTVDARGDEQEHTRGYASLYERDELAGALARCAALSRRRLARLPHAATHVMLLNGAVAYWLSDPEAREADTLTLSGVRGELGSALLAPEAVMRLWRCARRLRGNALTAPPPLKSKATSNRRRCTR